jgi:hypothetical protein
MVVFELLQKQKGFFFLTSFGLLAWLFLEPFGVKAQQLEGALYGKIITQTNQYEGPIRWGKEEALWLDFFNASKKEAEKYKNYQSQSSDDGVSWFDLNWNLESIWEDKNQVHQFNCQFGDIKTLKVTGRKNARLQFKNGWELDVMGWEYNDLGERIQILDKELGQIALDWLKIDRIEFENGPKKGTGFGEPIFGTVETNRREKFTGYIQWDKDERLASDKLDGNTRDGNVSVSFGDIQSIEKVSNTSCHVILGSGREITLSGSNDVNFENRGLAVLIPGQGSVEFPWSQFKKFTQSTPPDPVSWNDFNTPKPLTGKVFTLDEKEIEGTLVYDFDETLSLETLEGLDNGVKYTIPFRFIQSIRPRNQDYSVVELKSGASLLLGGTHDVAWNNGGVLVFQKGKKDPVHIPRKKIDQIVFH